ACARRSASDRCALNQSGRRGFAAAPLLLWANKGVDRRLQRNRGATLLRDAPFSIDELWRDQAVGSPLRKARIGETTWFVANSNRPCLRSSSSTTCPPGRRPCVWLVI